MQANVQKQRQAIKLRLMNETRRKKIEGLREREQLREYRSRLQSMLLQKLMGKYGDVGRHKQPASKKNAIIKQVVRDFMKSSPNFNEDSLRDLEAQVQQAVSALRSGPLDPLGTSASNSSAMNAGTRENSSDNDNDTSASQRVSASRAGRSQSGMHGGQVDPMMVESLTKGVNEWTLLQACEQVKNEEDAINKLHKMKESQLKFRKDLDTQVHLVRSSKFHDKDDEMTYFAEVQKRTDEWKKNQELEKQVWDGKMAEEKRIREIQIRDKKERAERELRARREEEETEIRRCQEEIVAEQRKIQAAKDAEAERMRKVKLENLKDREIRQQRKKAEALEDQKLMEAYKAKLEREEEERANAFARRMERLQASGQKWAEEGAGKEQQEFEHKLEQQILQEALSKEQADQERERRDKQAIKDKQRLMAESNRKLIEAKMMRMERKQQEDQSFAEKFQRDQDEYFRSEARKKKEKMEKMRKHQVALSQQIHDRQVNPTDPMKASMSDHERKINGEVLKRLQQEPELLLKVANRIHAAASPTKKSS